MGAVILVVEDEALVADDLERTLGALGYSVPRSVASGEEAIAAAEELSLELVLMDIKLGGSIDGITAARRIRDASGVPVVFLTSHSDEATLEQAKQVDPYGYVVKPFSTRELRVAIEVALRRRALEQRLEERERWFSTTLASIGEAVIAADAAGRVRFVNPVAEQLTGWPAAEATGRPVTEVVRLVDADRRPLPGLGTGAPRRGAPAWSEGVALVSRSGLEIEAEGSVAPIADGRGALLGTVLVFRDVRARRALERQAAVTEQMVSLGTLAAGIGHEINNPLSYMIANLAFSTELRDRLDESVRGLTGGGLLLGDLKTLGELLAETTVGVERVRRIVSDLMVLTRVGEALCVPLEVASVIERAVRLTAPSVRPPAVLECHLEKLPLVLGDEGRLVQVFTHLLLNALAAVREQGAAGARVQVRGTTDERGWALVEVEDQGAGIPDENLARIFHPFFTTRAVGEGTGLGLSISHAIVTGLGGSIVVESAVGRGSVFRVSLPPAATRG